MASYEKVRVVGLKELRKGLKALDEQTALDELKDAHFKIASRVGNEARGRASGISKMAGSAAETISASRAVGGAKLRYGGVPYAYGAEFGAYRDQLRFNVGGQPPRHGKGWNQFPGWSGSGSDSGYFLYPAIRDLREWAIEQYADDLERICAKYVVTD